MMRWFLFLCLAGFVVYALIPPRGEPDWNTPSEIDSAPESAIAQIEAKPPIDRKLRSWGPTLQALGQPGALQTIRRFLASSARGGLCTGPNGGSGGRSPGGNRSRGGTRGLGENRIRREVAS